jgi:shikimate dehydrogenase
MASLYGIVGYPLAHSFSPAYFKRKFTAQNIDAVYEPFAISTLQEFTALLETNPNIKGLSVTIPYKEKIIPYLNQLDSIAGNIGAVNCISVREGVLSGYNTDAPAFEQSLVPLLQTQHTHALILGTGGAAKAVAYSLKQLNIAFKKVSRRKSEDTITYEDLTREDIFNHKLIINTTPLGMYPNVESSPPIPYEALGSRHLLYDLIYNPEETIFLIRGKASGAGIKNGFQMLELQAEKSWEIWNSD